MKTWQGACKVTGNSCFMEVASFSSKIDEK